MSFNENESGERIEGIDDFSNTQSERIEASNHAAGELDLTSYAQSITDTDVNPQELDLTDFEGIGLIDAQGAPEPVTAKGNQAEKRANESAKSAAPNAQLPAKKGISTKNKVAGGLVLLLVIAIGYPIISAMMSSGGSSQPAISNEFVSGSEYEQSGATNDQYQDNQNQMVSVNPKINEAALLRSELDQVKLNTEKAFVLVQQKFIEAENKSQQQIEQLNKELNELKNQYKHLSDSGTNQIVDQGQKIEEIVAQNRKLQSSVQSIENENRKSKAKEKAEKEKQMTLALRAKFEVITVISGKARIRNVNTGNELNIEIGDEIDGFGKIKDIAITGCITFVTNEKYEPIGASCRNI